MDAKEAISYLMAEEDSDEFFEQLFILERMAKDESFCHQVVTLFNQIKAKG
jgi:hypothetical protein